jgi:hypothetical protein
MFAIYFSVEQKGVKNNLQTVMDNIRSEINDNAVSTLTSDHNVEPSVETPIRAMVERITFSEMQVELYLDDADAHSFVVPGFFIENIGDADKGLSPQALGKHITLHLMKAVNVAVQSELTTLLQSSGQPSPQDVLGELLQEAAQSGAN